MVEQNYCRGVHGVLQHLWFILSQSLYSYCVFFSLGMGRPAMERMIVEEMNYMQAAIQYNAGAPFDILVSTI